MNRPDAFGLDPGAPSPHPALDGTVTLVSPGSAFAGEIRSVIPLHLDCEFSGRIDATEDVIIAAAAAVRADICARRVILSGRFQGTMRLKERLEITPTGRFEGTLYLERTGLSIAPGGSFQGRIRSDGGISAEDDILPFDLPPGTLFS